MQTDSIVYGYIKDFSLPDSSRVELNQSAVADLPEPGDFSHLNQGLSLIHI